MTGNLYSRFIKNSLFRETFLAHSNLSTSTCHHLPLDQPIFFPQNPVVNNHFCPLLSSYEWAWWGSPSTDLGPGVTASLSRRPCPPQGRGSPVGMRCPGRDHGGRAQPAPGWPQVPPVQRLQQIQGPSHPQTPWRTALGSRETPWLRRAGREGEGSPLHPAHPQPVRLLTWPSLYT